MSTKIEQMICKHGLLVSPSNQCIRCTVEVKPKLNRRTPKEYAKILAMKEKSWIELQIRNERAAGFETTIWDERLEDINATIEWLDRQGE